jgi:hypothetical protein
MAAVQEGSDAGFDAARRAFLGRVAAILGTLPVEAEVAYGELETAPQGQERWGPGPGVRGLVVRSPRSLASVNGVAQVAAATVLDERDRYQRPEGVLTRERSLAFDPFPVPGRSVYRLYLLENPWEGRGHGRWSPPQAVVESEDPAQIAMSVAAWAAQPAAGHAWSAPTVPGTQLQRQVSARRAGVSSIEVVDDLGPAALREAAGEPDLAVGSRRLLAWHFPRDRQGRLLARAVVALACCRPGARPQARQLWLCAEGPQRPEAPERIHLRLRWIHGAHQDHRWDRARGLWDARAPHAGLDALWGIDDRARAGRSAALMAAGQFRAGLELYGVELSPEADRVAQGAMPWYALRHLTGLWAAAMSGRLALAAPWLLAAARDPGARPVRLFGLGGQPIARKPGLYLTGGRGRPRLEIHWSAANARLPLVAWQRPADYELLRLGLIEERELEDIATGAP